MENKLHLYKMTHWESSSGRWYCNDVKNLSGKSSKWYTAWRILDVPIEEYIELLLSFNAKDIKYYEQSDCLSFCFISEKDVKNYCSYVNKIARKKQYYCV